MAQLQYMPGDPRLVDQLVYELKSKGIFDQFRKECIADVDTRPAYQNLRQRVESSVSTFLSRQVWKPDLNKNQLREKLRKHILDGNYLEQGVERIVDQVVNPKVATVFIPQVEDLAYNYLGIPRKKSAKTEAVEVEDLLPTDLEAVSPGSVKSNDEEKSESENKVEDMEIDSQSKTETTDTKEENKDDLIEVSSDSASMDKSTIPLPSEEIKLENIPPPDNSPTPTKVELENIELPREPNLSTDIPLPDEVPKDELIIHFPKMPLNSEDSNSSSGSSLRRNMSPITPVRNFDDENSCDAQQAFENNSVEDVKSNKELNSFRFNIENKDVTNGSPDVKEKEKKDEQNLSFQFTNQVKINTFNTPLYEDSSNSHNLQIDYESDANSKTNQETKMEVDNSEDFKKERKDDKKSHKSSHRSRDSNRHSSSKDGKHSSSKEGSKHDKKPSSKDSKEEKSKSSRDKDKQKEGDKIRDSSKHRSSHKSSSSSKDKHRSSSTSHRHSSKSSDDKKSSSKDKDKSSEKDKDKKFDSRDKDRKELKDRKDSKSSSHRSDKDRKSSSSKKPEDKDKKKDKKDTDDHYSSSGRGNHSRRSTDRDSNDGSSSSKGSQNQSSSKSADNKKASKSSSSKSDTTSTSGESASPSDKEHVVDNKMMQFKPIVRVDNHLEVPIANPPRLPFVPDVTLKKPRFANNFEEAKKMMKMRKFLAEEQKRMNQEAALLLEFQANVRPCLSQVYSSIPGPELEFACVTHEADNVEQVNETINNESIASNEAEVIAAEEETESKPDKTESKRLDTTNFILEDVNASREPEAKPEETESKRLDTTNFILEDVNASREPEAKPEETESKRLDTTNFILEDVNTSREPEAKPEETESKRLDTTNFILEDVNASKDFDKNEFSQEMINEIIGVSFNEDQPAEGEKEPDVFNEMNTAEVIVEEIIDAHDDSYDENKPFSQLVYEISEYGKASEKSQDTDSKNTEEYREFEVTVITEALSEAEQVEIQEDVPKPSGDDLLYFAEHEKFNAELERLKFTKFLDEYIETTKVKSKMYLINCGAYEENIMKEMASNFGDFEVVNYYKNGHNSSYKTIVKDVLSEEISLPLDSNEHDKKSVMFSPVKSECSFDLSSDYDAKLKEIVNKKSRQEVMQIILGDIIDTSPSKMPTIDYYTECDDSDNNLVIDEDAKSMEFVESNTDKYRNTELVEASDKTETLNKYETKQKGTPLKRKAEEDTVNKISVLTPNKIRKISDSEQITSTTEEAEISNNNKVLHATRSKYLGRAKRVGLPRPKRCSLLNSPSSDKSVENYTQNTATPNGKLKPTVRTKIQRYDTSDLYKPKLHYLSRRNKIT